MRNPHELVAVRAKDVICCDAKVCFWPVATICGNAANVFSSPDSDHKTPHREK